MSSSSNNTPVAIRNGGPVETPFQQAKALERSILKTPLMRQMEQDEKSRGIIGRTPVVSFQNTTPARLTPVTETITPVSSNLTEIASPAFNEADIVPDQDADEEIPDPPIDQPESAVRRGLEFQPAPLEVKYENETTPEVDPPVNPLLNEFKSQPAPAPAPVPAPAPAPVPSRSRGQRALEYIAENRPKLKRSLYEFDGVETEEQAEERAAQLQLAQKVNKAAAKAYKEFRANKTPLLERLWGNQVETEDSAENWIVILLLLAVLGTMIAVLVTAGKKTSASDDENSDLQRGEATLWLVSTLALGLAFMYGILAAGFVGRILLIASWITYTVYALKALAS